MQTKFLKSLALSTALVCLSAVGAKASLADITGVQEQAAIAALQPNYISNSTESAFITQLANPALAGVKVGDLAISAAVTANAIAAPIYANYDASRNLTMMALVAGSWSTFTATLSSTALNATSTVDLTETLRDGVSPGTARKLHLIWTKTGTVTDLTAAAQASTVASILIQALGTSATALFNASGTAGFLTTTGINGAGAVGTTAAHWALTADIDDGAGTPTILAATLMPTAATFTAPLTFTTSATPIAFYSQPVDFTLFNVATSDRTQVPITFTVSGGKFWPAAVIPGLLARTDTTANMVISVANAYGSRRLTASTYRSNNLPAAVNTVTTMTGASDTLVGLLQTAAQGLLPSALITSADAETGNTVDSNNGALFTLAPSDITGTWSVQKNAGVAYLQFTATIGGLTDTFSINMNTALTSPDSGATINISNTANTILTLLAPQTGYKIWLKTLKSGVWVTGNTTTDTVATAALPGIIADRLAALLASNTTIAHTTLGALATKAAS